MIYTYKYLDSKIQQYHENIIYFFRKLFELELKDYDESLMLHPEFIAIVNQSEKRLEENLRSITRLFYALPWGEKSNLKIAFSKNVSISTICEEVDLQPVKYTALSKSIVSVLKNFFEMLWDEYPQNDLVLKAYGTVIDHFTQFTSESHQKALICPFCGLQALKPSGGKKRNPYDHYIPKGYYPFVSINFFNLVPACWDCNTDEKSDVDSPYLDNTRRKLLNPFDADYNSNQLQLTIIPLETYNPINLRTLLREIKYDYNITLDGKLDVRLKSWDEIYGIKRRYKEYLVSFEKEWFDELKTKYKRTVLFGVLWSDFEKDFFDDLEFQRLSSVFGMLRLSYFTFIFSISDFAKRLSEIVYEEI